MDEFDARTYYTSALSTAGSASDSDSIRRADRLVTLLALVHVSGRIPGALALTASELWKTRETLIGFDAIPYVSKVEKRTFCDFQPKTYRDMIRHALRSVAVTRHAANRPIGHGPEFWAAWGVELPNGVTP